MTGVKASLAGALVALRGPYTRAQLATALGFSRQAVRDLELGNVSITRLERLEDFYGVDFHVIAVDRATGTVHTGTAPTLPTLIAEPPAGLTMSLEPGGQPGTPAR